MIYFIDIDNTICKTIKSDYKNSIPYKKRIETVNQLFDLGNIIIYWTARGKSSGKDHNQLTIKQLKEWGCKYHEVRFDKPNYDLLIDDKSSWPGILDI